MAYINASGQMDNAMGLLNRVQIAMVTITSAQILTLFATPVQLLPAAGAGTFIDVYRITIQTKPGTANYASGGVLTAVYTGGSIVVHGSSIPAATITSGTATNNLLPPNASVIQPPANTGVTISNATGAFTTGNGTLVVKIAFAVRVID